MTHRRKFLLAMLFLCIATGTTGIALAVQMAQLNSELKVHLKSGQIILVADADQWSLRTKADEMTGEKETRLNNRQDNGSGAFAETEAFCEKVGQGHAVTFMTLIVDNVGSPTIGIANRASATEGKFVRIRYRQNDVTKTSRVPNGKFSNQFLTFSAIDDDAAEFFKRSPIGLNLYLAGQEGLLVYAHYSNVQLVKAEYQTDHGPLIVSIDTTLPSIRRLYASCVGGK